MRFKITEASNGQYYFEIQAAGNYETLATSETYVVGDKADVRKAINMIQQEAASAAVFDDTV